MASSSSVNHAPAPSPQPPAPAFEPRIVGFLCNWCSYAGADLAGVSRYQYPPNMRVVRVMCSTRVDPGVVLETFIQGADGVFVGGCHLGDCHYIKGNYHTIQRMRVAKRLLGKAGLEPARLRLEWVSASEGERFASLMKEYTEEVRKLGPSAAGGMRPDIALLERLFAAKNVLEDFRVRALLGKYVEFVEKGNIYGKVFPEVEMQAMLDTIADEELERVNILLEAREKPVSVTTLSKMLKMPARKVLEHIVTLRSRDLIRLHHIDGSTPLYIAPDATHAGGA